MQVIDFTYRHWTQCFLSVEAKCECCGGFKGSGMNPALNTFTSLMNCMLVFESKQKNLFSQGM